MQHVSDMTFHHVMSQDISAGVVSRCLPHGLGVGVSFSHDGRSFVLQARTAWYQHRMPNQQHQRTEGTHTFFIYVYYNTKCETQ